MAEDVEILHGVASMLEVFAVEISWSYEDSFALLVKNSDGSAAVVFRSRESKLWLQIAVEASGEVLDDQKSCIWASGVGSRGCRLV